MPRHVVVWVTAAPWVVALGCGGRTGDLDAVLSRDGGASGSGAFSGGAFRGAGGTSAGKSGVAASGATLGGGATSSAGTTFGGGATFGGGVSPPPPTGTVVTLPPVLGSAGATAIGGSAGASSGGVTCFQPLCECGDCASLCACENPGSLSFCTSACLGVGGAGGATASSDAGLTILCGDSSGKAATVCFAPPLPIHQCCPAGGGCGLELAQGDISTLPFSGGCLPVNQPGYADGRCPDLGTLIQGASDGVVGCCRPDGTCGVDLTIIGAGCVQSLSRGLPFRCDRSVATTDSGPPPVDAGFD